MITRLVAKFVIVTTAGLAVGLGVAQTGRYLLGRPGPAQGQGQALTAATVAPSPTPSVFATPPRPIAQRQAPMVRARLDAALLINGDVHPAADGRIALPSGSRFQLRLASTQAGILEVHAINPAGQSTGQPLWQVAVSAGAQVVTPMLRLAGTQGLETLRLVLVLPHGGDPVQRDVQIWNL